MAAGIGIAVGLAGVSGAYADSNDNRSDGQINCAAGPLASAAAQSSCTKDNHFTQLIDREHATSHDLIDYGTVLAPIGVSGP
ncbi:hypothetical protein [Streptomyces kanamyceticus]|uniref:hypothetical protein n=1 Tax=Streptomyces kanamyceticus TaxID=1967 RepID=UPI00123CEB43|nr:hypothetical protein [Streptomyces kanamyceticus]